MPGKTISEKILSEKSGRDARAGDLVVCRIDSAMGTDGSVPMAIDYFERMEGDRIFDPGRIVFVMDHYAACGHPGTAALQARMMAFAARYDIPVHDVGEGICHQLLAETGRTLPGELLVGADSHTVTGGALNAFATGIGSSDLAAAMICGRIWLRVPQTMRITLTGRPAAGISAKDIALALAGLVRADGAAYQTLEFHGPAVRELEVDDRLVLSNLSVEMGAKAGIFPPDSKTAQYLERRARRPFTPVEADPDARYDGEVRIDVSTLKPQIALPHTVDHVVDIAKAAGTPIQLAYLGTCTGGRTRDFHEALRILEAAGSVAPAVKLVAVPASREVEAELKRDGTLARLEALGAMILPPGCGSCCGTAGPIPADGVNVISTANRNFLGRMGNVKASIYLASPAACAAAAVSGRIRDPREFLEDHG